MIETLNIERVTNGFIIQLVDEKGADTQIADNEEQVKEILDFYFVPKPPVAKKGQKGKDGEVPL